MSDLDALRETLQKHRDNEDLHNSENHLPTLLELTLPHIKPPTDTRMPMLAVPLPGLELTREKTKNDLHKERCENSQGSHGDDSDGAQNPSKPFTGRTDPDFGSVIKHPPGSKSAHFGTPEIETVDPSIESIQLRSQSPTPTPPSLSTIESKSESNTDTHGENSVGHAKVNRR